MTDTVADRYHRAVRLLPTSVLPLLLNASPPRGWLDDRHLVCRIAADASDREDDGEQVLVLDVTSGQTRRATPDEAAAAPQAPPKRKDLHEADPPSPVVASPDGRWGIGQRDGNLELHDLADEHAEPAKLTTDGSPLDGYGIYYGNWKAGFVARSRAPQPLPPMGVTWAPDSARVIVPRIDQSNIEPYPFLETARHDGSARPKLHLAPFPFVGEELPTIDWYAFDVGARTSVRIELPDGLLFLHQDLTALRTITFSSDGTHAYVVAHGDHMDSAHLFDVDLTDGSVREVVAEHHHPRTDLNTTSYMPPNVAVVGDLDQVIWFSQRDGWGHLYRYDGRTGELINAITSGDWLVRDLIAVDVERQRIVFTGSGREPGNPYLRRLYRVGFDGSDLTRLSPEDGDCEAMPGGEDILGRASVGGVVSPDGAHVTYTVSTVDSPPVTVVRRSQDASLVATLTEADQSALEQAGYVAPREFVATAADGLTDLYGLLYLPTDFDEDQRYPVLVVQYASPLMAATPRNYASAVQGPPGLLSPAALAQLGCVCLVLDARGTTSRSRDFAEAGYGRLNVIGLDDHAAAIEQLGDLHAWMDTSRVGIVGGSYGGFTTIRAMIEFPEVFTVGIADAPLAIPHAIYPDYHWYSFHGVPTYDGQLTRPTDDAVPDNYLALDARAQVERIDGHLLVVVGELDENCPPSGVMPFVLAAYEADKDVDLLYVPNANHYTFGRTRYVIRRHLDFLTRHLVGEEVPEGVTLDGFEQFPEPAIRTSPNVW
ncbi:MAG TPA: prolyl oligopeptidase family serine peptidase [Nitriliruptorales bacterium]